MPHSTRARSRSAEKYTLTPLGPLAAPHPDQPFTPSFLVAGPQHGVPLIAAVALVGRPEDTAPAQALAGPQLVASVQDLPRRMRHADALGWVSFPHLRVLAPGRWRLKVNLIAMPMAGGGWAQTVAEVEMGLGCE